MTSVEVETFSIEEWLCWEVRSVSNYFVILLVHSEKLEQLNCVVAHSSEVDCSSETVFNHVSQEVELNLLQIGCYGGC